MPAEPAIKRAVAFVDGQNLFYAAKSAFGYTHPNYDPNALTARLCRNSRLAIRSSPILHRLPESDKLIAYRNILSAIEKTLPESD